MRFRAEQHLRRATDIRTVRERGQRLECRDFTVWWKQREAANVAVAEVPRVCVIASTAAVGGAVLRNRAKRRLREAFRQQQAAVPGDCDLLLIARRGALDLPMPELQSRFAAACQRIATSKRPA